MKRIIKFVAVGAILLCAATSTEAMSKNDKKSDKKVEWVTFLTDIDCHHCQEKIMKVLPYQRGVKDVVVDLGTKSVLVEYDATKSSEATIKESLTKLDVEVVGVVESKPKITPTRK